MLSLKLDYEVPEDRTLHIQLPAEIKPGKHEFILVINENAEYSETAFTNSFSTNKNPAMAFIDSGFIGCGEADPLLSENYKSELTKLLGDKHGDR